MSRYYPDGPRMITVPSLPYEAITMSSPRASHIEILHRVKQAIRQPYAWPGGYPLFVVMDDGESMSIDAARENWRQICRAAIGRNDRDWIPCDVQINWEDPELFCVHSGKRIESAYAEPDES